MPWRKARPWAGLPEVRQACRTQEEEVDVAGVQQPWGWFPENLGCLLCFHSC